MKVQKYNHFVDKLKRDERPTIDEMKNLNRLEWLAYIKIVMKEH